MATDCPKADKDDDVVVDMNCNVTFSSDTLDVTQNGDCESGIDVSIELKEEPEEEVEECDELTELFSSDFITIDRGGKCYKISVSNLMTQLDCSNKKCL